MAETGLPAGLWGESHQRLPATKARGGGGLCLVWLWLLCRGAPVLCASMAVAAAGAVVVQAEPGSPIWVLSNAWPGGNTAVLAVRECISPLGSASELFGLFYFLFHGHFTISFPVSTKHVSDVSV